MPTNRIRERVHELRCSGNTTPLGSYLPVLCVPNCQGLARRGWGDGGGGSTTWTAPGPEPYCIVTIFKGNQMVWDDLLIFQSDDLAMFCES